MLRKSNKLKLLLMVVVGFSCAGDGRGEWQWHKIEGAMCRDGSETGYFSKRAEGRNGDKLMIYFQGGNACFNAITCANTPKKIKGVVPQTGGVFSNNPNSPALGWSKVYIPYCTGDAYTGNKTGVKVKRVKMLQNFVGYTNVKKFLVEIVSSFNDVNRVMLIGTSAGSFGVLFNYEQIQQAFAGIPITLIADSGIPFSDEYLDPCFQQKLRDLWGIDENIPKDCDNCISEDGGGLHNIINYIGDVYPDNQFGIVHSLRDSIMRFFFGYSRNKCKVLIPNMPSKMFAEGLLDLRDNHLPDNFRTYYINGSSHGHTYTNALFNTKVDGLKLYQWMNSLLRNSAEHRL